MEELFFEEDVFLNKFIESFFFSSIFSEGSLDFDLLDISLELFELF